MDHSIKNIIEKLYNIKDPKGLSNDDMLFLENKFGKLPVSLKVFYSVCGSENSILHCQDSWITPEDHHRWAWLNDNKYMVLLNENQGCYIAAILEKDLGKADPEVYSSDDHGESWKLCADSADAFIKAVLYYEAVFRFPFSAESFYSLTGDEFEMLKDKLQLLPFHIDNWFGTIWLFQDSSSDAAFIIENDGDYQLMYGAASEDAFISLSEKLSGIGEEM